MPTKKKKRSKAFDELGAQACSEDFSDEPALEFGRCQICLEDSKKLRVVACKHGFCGNCWKSYLQASVTATCPHPDCGADLLPGEIYHLANIATAKRINKFAAARQTDLKRSCESKSWRTAERPCEGVRCKNLLRWHLTAHRVVIQLTQASFRVAAGAGMGAAVGIWKGYPAINFATWGAIARIGREVVLLTASKKGLVQCSACRKGHCFDCGTTCKEDAISSHRCTDNSTLHDWTVQNDVGVCPSCSSLIERSHGCNHMRCRCGQLFCWACGKPCGRGHTPTNEQGQCKCSLYGRRFYGRRRSIDHRWMTWVLAGAAFLSECDALANSINYYVPFAVCVTFVPGIVLCRNWCRATFVWLALISIVSELKSPLLSLVLLACTVGTFKAMLAPQPISSPVGLGFWLRRLPSFVVSSIPCLLVFSCVAMTKMLATVDGWIASSWSSGQDQVASTTSLTLFFAVVVLITVFVAMMAAFIVPWEINGVSLHDNLEWTSFPGLGLFSLVHAMSLCNFAHKLSVGWVLVGAYQWGLGIAFVVAAFFVTIAILDSWDVLRTPINLLIQDLGGSRKAAVQAMLAVSFFADYMEVADWLRPSFLAYVYLGMHIFAVFAPSGWHIIFRYAAGFIASGSIWWRVMLLMPCVKEVIVVIALVAFVDSDWLCENDAKPWVIWA